MSAPGAESTGRDQEPAQKQTTGNAVQRLYDQLKPWKELIAIILFFAAGVTWVAGYFATRKQLNELRCYARESVSVARAETKVRSTFDELVQKNVRLEMVEGRIRDASATDSEKIEQKRLQREIKDLETARVAAEKKLAESERILFDGKCTEDQKS